MNNNENVDDEPLLPAKETEKEKLPPITMRQWMIFAIIGIANFLMGTVYALQAPFFPEEAEKKETSQTVYGFIFGVYQLTILICAPLVGKLIGTISVNFLLNIGIFLSGASCFLFGFLDKCPPGSPFIGLAFAIRIFEAVGNACFFTASSAIIASTFPGRMATFASSIEMIVGLGLAAGPTLGGALYQLGGFFLPFVSIGAVQLLWSIMVVFFLPRAEKESEGSGSMWKLLLHGEFLTDALINITCLLFIGFNEATLEPHIRQFHLSSVQVGLIFMIIGGLYGFASPIWGYLVDNYLNPRYVSIGGLFVGLIGLLLIGPASFIPLDTSLWLVCVSLVILGISVGAKLISSYFHALKNAIDRGFPDDVSTYGMVAGLFWSLSSIGTFAGPAFGGAMVDNLGYRVSNDILIGIEIIAIIVAISYTAYTNYVKKHMDDAPLLDAEEGIINTKPDFSRQNSVASVASLRRGSVLY